MNLWSYLFRRQHTLPVIPTMVIATPPSSDSSCLVAGLVKSIKDHPDQWTYVCGYSRGDKFTHISSRVTVGIQPPMLYPQDDESKKRYLSISDGLGCGLSDQNKDMLIDTIDVYLVKPQLAIEKAARLEWESQEKARQNKIRKQFEQIGCP